jgi:hypothetical protein
MTSLAMQDVDQLGGRWSVLTRQKRDHARLDELLHRLVGSTGDRQREVMTQVNRLVFPHAFAEESVLWPVMRRVLPDGDELTLQVEQEHQEVNELVVALEKDDLDPATRAGLVDRLVEVLREDVRDEEDVLLPRLQEALEPAALRRLGMAWEAVRRISPTRPHPVVSRRPPGNALAALPLTVIDRMRDRLDRIARRVPATRASLTSVSRSLARVAGVLEQAPAFRTGQHARTHRA